MAGLFLLLQVSLLSHAHEVAEDGHAHEHEHEHEHEACAVCHVIVEDIDADILRPPAPIDTVLEAYVPFETKVLKRTKSWTTKPPGRAPPPRGPPSSRN